MVAKVVGALSQVVDAGFFERPGEEYIVFRVDLEAF